MKENLVGYYNMDRPTQIKVTEINQELQKILNQLTQAQQEESLRNEKIIPNNQIIGPDLVPTGQVNKIPLLPIAAGIGILILAVTLSQRRKKR